MARKSETSPVFTIVFIVLFIVASLFAGAFYSEQNRTKGELANTQASEANAKDQVSKMFDYNMEVAELVTGEQNVSIEAVRNVVSNAKKFLAGTTATSLSKILEQYQKELDGKTRGMADAEKKRDQAEKLLERERLAARQQLESKEIALKDRTEEVGRLNEELKRARSEAIEEKEKLKEATDQEVKDLNKQIADLKATVGAKDTQILENEEKIRKLTLAAETPVVAGVAGPVSRKGSLTSDKELADGRILQVDESMRLAVIDLGRNERVKRGLRFNVYRDGGVSSRHLKGQIVVKKVHDLISEAFVTFQRGQGQVFHLVGDFEDPTKSEMVEKIKSAGGKVVDTLNAAVNYLVIGKGADAETLRKAQDLKVPSLRAHQLESFLFSSDTIRPGDIIVNPAFDRRRQERFFLFGDFVTPKEVLKEKIEQYGSKVAEELDVETDYLVIGARGLPEEKETLKKAAEFGISIIKEEELLAFLED
ncbi:MAG: hypothetical protein HYU36_14585 [Planctomycetes bacterium]|nr:hypothetical protein [Planctomycetota bacterium]